MRHMSTTKNLNCIPGNGSALMPGPAPFVTGVAELDIC